MIAKNIILSAVFVDYRWFSFLSNPVISVIFCRFFRSVTTRYYIIYQDSYVATLQHLPIAIITIFSKERGNVCFCAHHRMLSYTPQTHGRQGLQACVYFCAHHRMLLYAFVCIDTVALCCIMLCIEKSDFSHRQIQTPFSPIILSTCTKHTKNIYISDIIHAGIYVHGIRCAYIRKQITNLTLRSRGTLAGE